MATLSFDDRRRLEALEAEKLAQHQLARLNDLLATILPANRFYAEKFDGVAPTITSLDDLRKLPFTTKDELVASADGSNRAANLTWPAQRYVRYHQTSGTSGRPMAVLDTQDDWRWWMDVWQFVLDAADVTEADRAMMAFSFGPFIGFWSAHDAVAVRGAMVIPGGGLSTRARIELMRTAGATIVFCTPTYALRMAEVAAAEGLDLQSIGVTRLVVAGEPGGSIPSIRCRIEQAWNACVIDHSGATEVGPWGYGDAVGRGLWVNEAAFIAETIVPETGQPAAEGDLAELLLTNLGRAGCPLIRYRTGDLVRAVRPASGPRRFLFLEGGILGRADDMMIIRGVNIFPSSIDGILRAFPEVAEYRMTATRQGQLDRLSIEVEDERDEPGRIERELELRLGLKIGVSAVPAGSLPRFEAKGRRFVDLRGKGD